jgi:RNA polymerase sigma factor (sigma-70 family)
MSEDELTSAIVEMLPTLRAYALVLTKSTPHADDLVQDALERAWRNRLDYRSDSGLRTWLFSILRNRFIDHLRRERMTVQDIEGGNAARLISLPDQHWKVQYNELFRAIDSLPPDVRDPLLLVISGGLTHREAALVLGCPLGTIKSRIRRALGRLVELVDINLPDLDAEDAV